jgi:hypothetical protein
MKLHHPISYYITQIEKKLLTIPKRIRPPFEARYNDAFNNEDDALLLRRLRQVNELLNQELDAIAEGRAA